MHWRLIFTLSLTMLVAKHASADDGEFFRRQVAPVFERHCVRCHQGERPKGGLSLASSQSLRAGGESGAAVVPGKPQESPLWLHVAGDKPLMPKNARPLSREQTAAIEQWIAAGAVWPAELQLAANPGDGEWWSLLPLADPAPPPLVDPWIRTPVDAFILAKLREQGLAPSPEADRRTLVRRLTFDLHGLPPTPEEVVAFLADDVAGAYERLVDRLLASPRYGERAGRHWLDLVHFGETHGYDKDKVRLNAWPYRDYVIDAFNADKRYSRFVSEQLAGDVLFPDDPQAVAATGFIAAGPWDFVGHVELKEGTVDKQIARSNDRDDMVMTAASTFLSLTVHCARCHDHKFDPVPQTDYYALQAVFAGVDRADRSYDADPATAAARRQLLARQQAARERSASLQALAEGAASPELKSLAAQLAGLDEQIAKLLPAGPPPGATLGYHSEISSKQESLKWVQVDLGESHAVERVALFPAHVKYGGHAGPGFGFPPRFKVELSDDATFTTAQTLADHASSDFPPTGDAPYVIETAGQRGRYVRVTAPLLWKRTDDWILALGELAAISAGKNVARGAKVTSFDSIEAGGSWGRAYLVDGQTALGGVDGLLQQNVPVRLQRLRSERGSLHIKRREAIERLLGPEHRRAVEESQAELASAARGLASLPPQRMVYAGTNDFAAQGGFSPATSPRPIHLLKRGDVKSPGELASPGALSCLPEWKGDLSISNPLDEGQRRAALARWIVDPKNALARRSIVNRVWQQHFGRGLVETPNDFGRMGASPTHPQLLDWLARELQRRGESLKALHRLIVTSATYRQCSASNDLAERADSGNRWLWRMPRARLDAESLRDAVLSVSGKLDLTMGGPSVQQFRFKDDHSPVYDYANFDVDDPKSWRRGVYRFVVRSVPDPFMECLDCADPSLLTPVRNATLTALQSLALLNDRFMVRQAEHLAARLEREANDPPARIDRLYRLTLNRSPAPEEASLLLQFAREHGLPNACRVVLNSNEFLFVD